MQTEAGTELTEEEVKLINSLQRLAKKWENTPNRLWLFSASGSLAVMMEGNLESNNVSKSTDFGGVNPDNLITTIQGIRNDGGDW